jgi:aryl-alcohol dehydrogenase-like predicted oxidoreductase
LHQIEEVFMHTRSLGSTGLQVAPLCLGGNVFGWTCDEPTSFEVLDAYMAGGGNFIDTADVYSRWAPGHTGGESEAVLGRWMQARGNRAEVIIATKAGSPMGDGPNQRGLSRQHIMHAVEASLRRLQTDYIDLYQAHFDDPHTPLDETLRAFDDLIRQGKVRYIGASNYHSWRLMQALWTSDRHGYAAYVCLQPKYNLVDRAEFEAELAPMCQAMGLGVISYSSVAGGFLSGKYRRDGAMPTTARAGTVQQRYFHARGWAVLDAVLQVAEARGATPTQVALSWLLAKPVITAPIASATSVAQLRELLGAVKLQLTAEEIALLESA